MARAIPYNTSRLDKVLQDIRTQHQIFDINALKLKMHKLQDQVVAEARKINYFTPKELIAMVIDLDAQLTLDPNYRHRNLYNPDASHDGTSELKMSSNWKDHYNLNVPMDFKPSAEYAKKIDELDDMMQALINLYAGQAVQVGKFKCPHLVSVLDTESLSCRIQDCPILQAGFAITEIPKDNAANITASTASANSPQDNDKKPIVKISSLGVTCKISKLAVFHPAQIKFWARAKNIQILEKIVNDPNALEPHEFTLFCFRVYQVLDSISLVHRRTSDHALLFDFGNLQYMRQTFDALFKQLGFHEGTIAYDQTNFDKFVNVVPLEYCLHIALPKEAYHKWRQSQKVDKNDLKDLKNLKDLKDLKDSKNLKNANELEFGPFHAHALIGEKLLVPQNNHDAQSDANQHLTRSIFQKYYADYLIRLARESRESHETHDKSVSTNTSNAPNAPNAANGASAPKVSPKTPMPQVRPPFYGESYVEYYKETGVLDSRLYSDGDEERVRTLAFSELNFLIKS